MLKVERVDNYLLLYLCKSDRITISVRKCLEIGCTGHLHLEISKEGKMINPESIYDKEITKLN